MRRLLSCTGILVGVILAGFLLAQLVPFGRSHANPAVVKEPTWDSATTRDLAKRACFDCHSNETVWPWYTNIAPVSWLTQRDVDEGRGRLNFSDYQGLRREGGGESERRGGENEIARSIERGSMPPWYYVMIHPTAALTDQEKQQLISGLQNSLK
jgi:cytochrome c551/c552